MYVCGFQFHGDPCAPTAFLYPLLLNNPFHLKLAPLVAAAQRPLQQRWVRLSPFHCAESNIIFHDMNILILGFSSISQDCFVTLFGCLVEKCLSMLYLAYKPPLNLHSWGKCGCHLLVKTLISESIWEVNVSWYILNHVPCIMNSVSSHPVKPFFSDFCLFCYVFICELWIPQKVRPGFSTHEHKKCIRNWQSACVVWWVCSFSITVYIRPFIDSLNLVVSNCSDRTSYIQIVFQTCCHLLLHHLGASPSSVTKKKKKKSCPEKNIHQWLAELLQLNSQ